VKAVVEKGGYDKIIASSSAFGKDIAPRLGGLLDIQPITDVIQIIVRTFIFKSTTIIGWRS
jgi:electron transfer flavoprotein alpha subunit